MRKNFSRWLFLLCAMLATAAAQAYDINSSDIRFASNYDGANGSYDVTIPIYDDGGADEGLHKNGASYVKVKVGDNEYTLCNMYSFPGAGDPQPDGSSYWVAIKKTSDTGILARMEVNGTEITSEWQRVTANKSGSKTSVTLRFYVGASILQASATYNVYLRIDKNNASDYDVSNNSTTINALRFPDPAVSGPTNGSAGYQDVTVSVSNYDGTPYLYATDNTSKEQTGSKTYQYLVGDAAQNKTVYVDYSFPYNRIC